MSNNYFNISIADSDSKKFVINTVIDGVRDLVIDLIDKDPPTTNTFELISINLDIVRELFNILYKDEISHKNAYLVLEVQNRLDNINAINAYLISISIMLSSTIEILDNCDSSLVSAMILNIDNVINLMQGITPWTI